jgi:adenylylsulfate kinase
MYFNTFSHFQIEIKEDDGDCPTPKVMAGQVVTYLEEKGFLEC